MQQLTFLDLCSGIGGFRLGLESAGHRCIGYCEYDRFARASYEAMYDTEGEWKADDVTKLKSEDVPYADIWCFGFPCQDISVAGKQRGLVGERSGIYYNIIDLIKGKEESDKPTYLLVENVKNLLSINSGFKVKGVMGCANRHVEEETLIKAYLMAWNVLVENREDFMEQWTEQLQSENLLESYRAEKFIEYTDGAEPLTKMDTDFMLKTLDHIKVFEDGTLLVVFLDGTEIECKNEEE